MGFQSQTEGRPLEFLKKIRELYPIALHGVSLSIGSTDELNFEYLKNLKRLIHEMDPMWVSDHICWTGVNGENLHDLLPLPYTRESLQHLCERIDQVQNFLGRKMVFENVSAYLSFQHSEMSEWDFLGELSRRSGCRLLLDVNNIFVSSRNQNFDPVEFIKAIPPEQVQQIHLAGHSETNGILIDTHDAPVIDPVWDLYQIALKHLGPKATMIEWDDRIPDFPILEIEAFKAQKILQPFLRQADEPSLFA